MLTVNVAQAKARLSEILDRVENGGEVLIARRGQPIARLCPAKRAKKPIDFAALDSVRARQPLSRVSSVRLIRKMRDRKY
jgi:prevent-host-death family protein